MTPPSQLSQPQPRYRFARDVSPRFPNMTMNTVHISPSPPETQFAPIQFYVDEENMEVEEQEQVDEDLENSRPRVVQFVDQNETAKVTSRGRVEVDELREETKEEKDWIDEIFEDDPIQDFED
jgi:hypothetical protein